MFSNPYVYQLVDLLINIPVVEHAFTLSDSILRTLAMVQVGIEGVNSNPNLGTDKLVAKIICGTLAGCGGGLWIGIYIYTVYIISTVIKCFFFILDAFRLNQPNWSFSTPRLLHIASIDMKISLATSLFYIGATTPAFVEYLSLPLLKAEEAQAWSVIMLTSGLVYGSYTNKLAKRTKALQELKEKSLDEKSE